MKDGFLAPKTINTVRPPSAPNEKAVLALASWSDACGIRWSQSAVKGCDLTVYNARGGLLEVAVIHKVGQDIPAGSLAVAGYDLTSPNREIALGGFWKVTEALGHGKPIPVDRGVEPTQKLCYKDDMDLVAMRHWPLRSSPNLPQEKIAPFLPIIDRCVKFFYHKNKRFMDLFGYKPSDLETYAHMWLLIYFHHYRKLFKPLDENKKLFTRYCQQKFVDFRQVVQSKANGCFPEGDSLQVAFYEDSLGKQQPHKSRVMGQEAPARGFASSTEHEYDRQPLAIEDIDYQKRHALLNKDSDAKRRKSAVALLAENLSKLPCPRRSEVLRITSENMAFDYDTRMEARRQWRKHGEDCSVCPKVDEDVGSVDATGT